MANPAMAYSARLPVTPPPDTPGGTMTATPETGTPPEPSAEDVKLSGTAVTEWGVRYEGEEARTIPYGTSRSSEQMARLDARTDAAKVVSRTVTYGPWEEA